MTVVELTRGAELANILEVANHPKMIIYFTAQWCGPCRAIAPVYVKTAESNPDIVFVKIDIDVCNDHPMVKAISSVPTFYSYRQGAKVMEFSGADQTKLNQMVQNLK
eukprot:gene243-295_t